MGKKTSTKNRRQKLYKMKGCSKKTCKKYLGGSSDVNLAYTGKPYSTSMNPFLAYTGTGGNCAANLSPSVLMPINANSLNKTLPNTGPQKIEGSATPFLNAQGYQRGGCGCGLPLMNGGSSNFAFPNGQAGSPWTSSVSSWPGVNGVQGGSNYFAKNDFKTDVQTSMISSRTNPAFSVGGKRRKKSRKHKKYLKYSKKQKGGTISNFLSQDLINLGRQFEFGLGSAYNNLAGYAAPINPLPWKGQMPNTPSLNTIKAASF
jgi:hypothetical protein